MKTQNNKLDFKKESIVELNDNQLNNVNGGFTTTFTLTPIALSVASLVASVAVSVYITRNP